MENSSSMIFKKIPKFLLYIFLLIIDLLPNDEAIIKRLLANPSVEGIILTDEHGQLQYTSLDNNVTFVITSKLLFFADKARETVRDLDPTDDLITFRLRTRSKEMMAVTPKTGTQVIAIQKINLSSSSTVQQNTNE
jgi:dynein light chain roadblock-type